MELYIVSTPIGNMGDITMRAVEVLKLCDLILAEDTRTSAKLFSLLGFKKPMISYHKFNERQISQQLAQLFMQHKKIALICDAGTPAICDPGAIVIKEARRLGAKIFVAPGASALAAAVSLSGESEPQFCFLGFFPRETKERCKLIKKVRESGFVHFVFYESPNRICDALNALNQLPVNEVRVFNDLTKKFEREYTGSLKQVASQIIQNEKASLGEYVVSFSIAADSSKKDSTISESGLLADYIVNNNVSVKQAIDALAASGANKNNLKRAALKLKDIFKDK